MRVLNSVVDPRMGGPQRRSLSVAQALTDLGIETVFLIPEGDDGFDDAATAAGFDTYRMSLSRLRPPTNVRGNLKFLGTFPRAARRIGSLLRTEQIHAVHANMSINFYTALAAARTDVPLAWHFNDTLTPTPVRQIAALLGRRWADELVVAADAVHDYYFSSSISSQTIYAPVDLDEFNTDKAKLNREVLQVDLDIPANVPIVGTIGNLNPIKGHEYLLRAVAEMADSGREFAVPIVGAKLDSQQAYYKRLENLRAELGLTDTVRFVGYRSDVPELLSLFDVFVHPSVAEACPIVVLEAMAMECPVVATRVGGVPEQLPGPEYGWVVPPRDSEALAGALETALSNPDDRERRAANARSRVESEFSLELCAERHERLYRYLHNKK